ncbi:MFS transporter [Rhizohabitans arisaemae]|uniref:MFS transporter n=1 Tax=Rhizohabitans arisaemae TaxID=2720610 RepID=UPI0024B17549|nr:MFS transporter [Rhizohabitans arisaemae]
MSFAADLRTVLAGRDFRRLFATRLVSQFADGVFQFAVAGYAFFTPEKQTSAAEAATAFAVLLLPYSLVGPFAGVFIDRWSRRQILVVAPVIRGVLLLLAAGLVYFDAPEALFYTTALGVLGVNRFFLAALGASLPHVVPREQLVMANAVAPTSGTVLTFLGAGAGYLLRSAFGPGDLGTTTLLACSGVLVGLSSLVAVRMRRDLLGPDVDQGRPQMAEALKTVVTGLMAGARHVLHRRQAAAALGAFAVHRFFYGMAFLMTVLLFRFYFTNDAEAGLDKFTLVIAVSGLGYFAAAPITPWVVDRIRPRTFIALLLALAGVVTGTAGVSFNEYAVLGLAFVLGVAAQGIKICVDSIVQREVDDVYLGRVFSIYDMIFNATFVVAAVVAVPLLPADGKSYLVLGIVATGYLLGAVGYWFGSSDRTRGGDHSLRDTDDVVR